VRCFACECFVSFFCSISTKHTKHKTHEAPKKTLKTHSSVTHTKTHNHNTNTLGTCIAGFLAPRDCTIAQKQKHLSQMFSAAKLRKTLAKQSQNAFCKITSQNTAKRKTHANRSKTSQNSNRSQYSRTTYCVHSVYSSKIR